MKLRFLLLAAFGALLVVPVAGAHVTANPAEFEAGGFTMIAFRVPHGCEESPTTSLTIRIPAGVVFVTPQRVPGWEVTTKQGKLAQPVEAEGETLTEGVTQVTWTGGPLPVHEFTDFGISMKMPDTPGKTLYFPAVQRCSRGLTRWIQIPVAGEPEPDEPAPGVKLVAAAAEQETPAASAETDDEDELDGATIAALGLGGAGLVAGLAALFVTLRRRPQS
jgi:periplasmic copper chaperone A